MKKFLTYLSFISLVIIMLLTILLFIGHIELVLWVKYALLINVLIVLITIYIRLGKRTVFEESIYCLRNAEKSLRKLNFNSNKNILDLGFLRIRNYLSFGQRYMENIYSDFDIHEVKIRINNIKEIKENITTSHISELKEYKERYIITLQETIEVIKSANNKRIETLNQKKEGKEAKLNHQHFLN